MHAKHRMANQNGHGSSDIEHGYQDWRDQRDRERGRDDFKGLDRDTRMGNPSNTTGEHGDRYQGGGQLAQGGRDQFAERDRDQYGDHTYDRDRDWVSNEQHDGNSRANPSFRGQSGSSSGGRYGTQANTNINNQQGGNRGHWGEFDRGGQSGGRDMNYDTMSPQTGRNSQQGSGGQQQQQQRGPHAGKGPQGFQRSDERIKEMVHEALTDHDHIDATHITVEVNSGEVVLTGTVEDRQAKRLAEDICERVTGVKDVLNQLRLQGQGRTDKPKLS